MNAAMLHGKPRSSPGRPVADVPVVTACDGRLVPQGAPAASDAALDAVVPEVVRAWLACPFDGAADLTWGRGAHLPTLRPPCPSPGRRLGGHG